MLLEIFATGLDYISGWQLTLTCITMVVVGLVILIAEPLRKFISRHILLCMNIIFILGFILYAVGFYEGASKNPLTLAFRAAISSLEMFTSHSDLIEVAPALKEENPLYMICFSLVHFLAVIVSAILILDIFGKRLSSREYAAILGNSHLITRKSVYMFDGVDDRSISLAKSVWENRKDNDLLIIFVRGSLPTDMKRFSLVDLFMNPSARKEEELGVPNAKLVYSSHPLSTIVIKQDGKLYKSLLKLMMRAKSTSVFFLSNDAAANASAALSMKNAFDEKGHKATIYANVDFKSNYSYQMTQRPDHKTEVRFINAPRLAAEYLKSEPELQPENFTYDGHFKAIVLGFSTTGQEVFNALYEVGHKLDFKCTVLDKQMHYIKGEYLSTQHDIAHNSNIELLNMDYYSTEFWDLFQAELDELNFVVLCFGDETVNITVAFKLYEYALLHRKNKTDNFKIFVKTKNTGADKIATLLHHRYSQLDAAKTIVSFGSSKQVFNYKLISLALASIIVFC